MQLINPCSVYFPTFNKLHREHTHVFLRSNHAPNHFPEPNHAFPQFYSDERKIREPIAEYNFHTTEAKVRFLGDITIVEHTSTTPYRRYINAFKISFRSDLILTFDIITHIGITALAYGVVAFFMYQKSVLLIRTGSLYTSEQNTLAKVFLFYFFIYLIWCGANNMLRSFDPLRSSLALKPLQERYWQVIEIKIEDSQLANANLDPNTIRNIFENSMIVDPFTWNPIPHKFKKAPSTVMIGKMVYSLGPLLKALLNRNMLRQSGEIPFPSEDRVMSETEQTQFLKMLSQVLCICEEKIAHCWKINETYLQRSINQYYQTYILNPTEENPEGLPPTYDALRLYYMQQYTKNNFLALPTYKLWALE